MKLKKLREELESEVIAEFEELTERLDKFRLILIYPEFRCLLNNRDEQYFMQIQKAFSLVYKMKVEVEAVSMIENHIEGAERRDYARQIFKDMHFVFDEFMTINVELENKLYSVRQKRDAAAARRMAESSQDMDYVSKIEERAAKAGGYDRPENMVEERPLPKLLIITSDRSALESQKKGERADFEELIEDDGDSTGEI